MADLSADSLIGILVGISGFAGLCTVWIALRRPEIPESRLMAASRHRDRLRRAALAAGRHPLRRDTFVGVLRRVAAIFNLLKEKNAAGLGARLAQAGWRSRDAMMIYLVARVGLPILLGGVAALVVFSGIIDEMSDLFRPGLMILAIAFGAAIPDLIVRQAVSRRQLALRRALPDGLDLLVICAEAGQALDGALVRVSTELVRNSPELADELAVTAAELGFLPERRIALDNLVARTGLPAIRVLAGTLIQTERYGTPLARALRVLAAEMRDERMMRAEEKAARLPAIMTLPLVLFILPTLFIVLLGPAALRAIDGLRGF
jgi:tight adherence protein C